MRKTIANRRAPTHSEKALETFRQMNTVPADWGITDIEWKLEKRKVPTEIECPECRGKGQGYYDERGDFIAGKYELGEQVRGWLEQREGKKVFRHYRDSELKEFCKEKNFELKMCRKCGSARCSRRDWEGVYIGTGKVIVLKTREVWIGYIQWAEGTRFDSRFHNAIYNRGGSVANVCELCSKSISKSHMVPVTGKGPDGVIHGMYVGIDCGRKFIGVKNFKKDQFLAESLED